MTLTPLQPLLEGSIEKEELGQHVKPLLPLFVFLQDTVAFILVPRTRGNEINATCVFLSSRCLCASSRTRRVVNLDFRYCLVAGDAACMLHGLSTSSYCAAKQYALNQLDYGP